jgi:copper(I)-binding protein
VEPLIGPLGGDRNERGPGPKRPMPKGAIIGGLVVVAALAYGGLATREDRGDLGVPVVSVERAVVTEGSSEAAGYLTIVNEGSADQLVAVDSPAAGTVSIHHSEDRDGVVVMVPASSLTIGARGHTVLAPGGTHLMLEDLHEPLAPGDQVTLVLSFGRSGQVTVTASVLSYRDIARSIDQP